MNNKTMNSLLFVIGVVCLAMAIMLSWDTRNENVRLREWKATYESGYCPMCGAKLGE